ncbi:GHMP kinase [Candidatus Woesearchaeota archaeon]|nr:GHMP kinase [Candidatus Woesearchaeota archaeon]
MVKAFAPANISCIFSIVDNKNSSKKGSLGMGFTVNKGVTVSIKKITIKKRQSKKIKNKVTLYFNNKKIKFPTVETVVKKLNKNNENLEIRIKSQLPLSCGFGISGASALATAYALNALLKLKKEPAKIAHIAEVENKTGLGDVINQYYGGFLIKYEPSYKFKVKRLNIKNKKIYYKVFSRLDTKKMITNKKIKNKINQAGINSLKKIKSLKKPQLNKLISISKEFAVDSGLLKDEKIKDVIKTIEKNNGNASMIMLGNAVFSDKRFKGCRMVKIADKRACLL